ncbi:hypothetical protein QBC41DRAFT_141614 [Cercophora samala]|uniref:Uncharacterized protein n=1 Tax=Cercophora samala TaxID=330535 RepID=A0AA40DB87_9PEZI|nr:hypothetical protein QBC41DRAFT_141614 [Cercophora samala]
MVTCIWSDDGLPASSSTFHPYAFNTAAAATTMSQHDQHDQQSSRSSWDLVPDEDFSVDEHTRDRSPQRNENNFASGQIGFGAATFLNAARPYVPDSTGDSTEIAGTNDTAPADTAAATQHAGDMTTTTTTHTPASYNNESTYTAFPYNENDHGHPDLTYANMMEHEERTYPHDVDIWVYHAGTRRLNKYQATSQRYSSSVVSTRSAVSNTSAGWVQVIESAPEDDVFGMGAWTDDAIENLRARPDGH